MQDADLRRLAEAENESMAFSFPATNKGFTKGRVEYNRPLMLDLRTIGQHLDKVLLFSHMEPAVRDVNKLLSDKEVSRSLGRIDPTQGPEALAYGVLRALLDGGNAWVKLSGAYMRSAMHATAYADTLPLGRALVQAAPERLVWGSDWPHTTEAPGTVNDADLLDLLQAWAGSDAVADRILVDNPARLYGFDIPS